MIVQEACLVWLSTILCHEAFRMCCPLFVTFHKTLLQYWFTSVSSHISADARLSGQISSRIQKAPSVFTNLWHLWRQRDIWLSTKQQIFVVAIGFLLLYCSETTVKSKCARISNAGTPSLLTSALNGRLFCFSAVSRSCLIKQSRIWTKIESYDLNRTGYWLRFLVFAHLLSPAMFPSRIP